jgi:hypothetical protein
MAALKRHNFNQKLLGKTLAIILRDVSLEAIIIYNNHQVSLVFNAFM